MNASATAAVDVVVVHICFIIPISILIVDMRQLKWITLLYSTAVTHNITETQKERSKFKYQAMNHMIEWNFKRKRILFLFKIRNNILACARVPYSSFTGFFFICKMIMQIELALPFLYSIFKSRIVLRSNEVETH